MTQTFSEREAGSDGRVESNARSPQTRFFIGRIASWAPVVAAVVLLGQAGHTVGSYKGFVTATAIILVTQVLPGALVWRVVRPRDGWWLEDLVMGFAVGSVMAIAVQIVAGLLGNSILSWATLLPAAVLVIVPSTRARILQARTTGLPWWVPVSVAVLALSFVSQLRGYYRLVPMDWSSGARGIHVDAYLHLALSAELAERGPVTFPWVQSEPLGYHWFSHAWVAQVGRASGSELDVVLFRVMPALMPVIVAAAVAVAAIRLTGRAWVGPVAALLALWGGDINVFGKVTAALPIAPLSPSLALAAPMLVAAVVLLAMRWERRAAPGSTAVLMLVCLGAAGTKGSTTPLLVAGLALTAVAMLILDRAKLLRTLLDLAIVTTCLLLAIIFVFRGSGAGLALDPAASANENSYATWLGPVEGTWHVMFVVMLVALGVVGRGVTTLLLLFGRRERRAPSTWLLIGIAGAAAGASSLFGHPGWSQHYFARSADPLIAIGSAMGLAFLVDQVGRRDLGRVVVAGIVGGFCLVTAPLVLVGPLEPGAFGAAAVMMLTGVMVLGLTAAVAAGQRSVPRALPPVAAAAVAVLVGGLLMNRSTLMTPAGPALADKPITGMLATSVDQINAARWIRKHSAVDDLVMTNRHCTTPVDPVPGCDSRRWVVAAFSERQMLVEGWTAVPRSAQIAPEGRDSITVAYWDQELLQLNDGFIADPTQAAADELRERGVRWVYADRTRPRAETLEPFAELRYSNDDVDVYELPAA